MNHPPSLLDVPFSELTSAEQDLYLEILGMILGELLRRATPGELAIARARMMGVNVAKPGESRN